MRTDRILELYDEGIVACREHDAPHAVDVVLQLIGALNYEYREAADRFFELYDFCLDRLETRRFDGPLRVLRALREAWSPRPTLASEPLA